MTEHDDIREALRLCVAGDSSAYECVVNAYKDKAYYFALMFLNNHHDSLDLSQDAFIRAFHSLDKYDLEKPFLPWFFCILRNLCLNEIQKRTRRPENNTACDLEEMLQIIPSKIDDPKMELMRQEQATIIKKAVSELPSEQKEVVFLRHYNDLSYEEIAVIVGIPTGTVMSRLFNGRRKLAEIIKKTKKYE